jgi:hypothetical protein
MVDQLNGFASEVTRVAREVGTEGRLGGQAGWCRRGGHLEGPHRQRQPAGGQPDHPGPQHAEVTTAVARGDLSRKITVDVKGEVLELKVTINTMVDQLNAFARGGHSRGPRGRHRGKLGGQARCSAWPAPGKT